MKIKTKTKSFKIGEYAIGGIIKVNLTGRIIQVYALDWHTKEIVSQESTGTFDPCWMNMLNGYLNRLTTYYYADKIIDWIKKEVVL